MVRPTDRVEQDQDRAFHETPTRIRMEALALWRVHAARR